ncbi:MAG TPA: GNAT family N-acetyltransferase [Dactylosporangium sp.]|nr:GNAT family N-acetyltransferase [Dactylosporangium sp.]
MPTQQHTTPFVVRPARPDDDPGIADVARRNAQPESQSGADAAYTAHLRDRGRLLVADRSGRIIGYAATVGIGAASMLTDLFVDPETHGSGTGKALLSALWPAATRDSERFTFASHDPRALSVYVRAGLTPWWPLLYLRGRPAALPQPGVGVARVTPGEAGRAEARLTGTDREGDLALLAGGDPAGGLVMTRDGQVVAAGAADAGNLAHLACPDPATAADAVVAGLRALQAGDVSVCLPGPHPAVPALLEGGFRIVDFDVHMAARSDLLATSWAYSPSLG